MKHAFILAYYYLLRAGMASSYEELDGFHKAAITELIGLAGDTDTNACIMGTLLGALLGANRIDKVFLGALFSFDCEIMDKEKNPQPRPGWMNVGRRVIDSIEKLLKCRAK